MIKVIVYNEIVTIIFVKNVGFKIMLAFRFQKRIGDLKAGFHILFIYSRDFYYTQKTRTRLTTIK
jgi:hypothetical protein